MKVGGSLTLQSFNDEAEYLINVRSSARLPRARESRPR